MQFECNLHCLGLATHRQQMSGITLERSQSPVLTQTGEDG